MSVTVILHLNKKKSDHIWSNWLGVSGNAGRCMELDKTVDFLSLGSRQLAGGG